MATHHQTREVRVWSLHQTDTEGRHFSPALIGTWAEILAELAFLARRQIHLSLFVEGTDGKLRPLLGLE